MAQRAYRKASRWTGWWLIICLTGVIAQIALMLFLSRWGWEQRMGAWSVIPGVLPLLTALAVGWWVMARFNRQRLIRLARRLETLGFRMTEKPSETEKSEFAAPMAHLFPALELSYGATSIEWFAVENVGSPQMRLFEHEFCTGSGKSTQVHHHTVAAWPVGHAEVGDAGLSTVPWFMMGQYSWLVRRVYKDRELRDASFADLADRWTLLGDASTGSRFLTPRIRAELEKSPKGEIWCMGAGWVCCLFKGTLDAENLSRFLNHARLILAK